MVLGDADTQFKYTLCCYFRSKDFFPERCWAGAEGFRFRMCAAALSRSSCLRPVLLSLLLATLWRVNPRRVAGGGIVVVVATQGGPNSWDALSCDTLTNGGGLPLRAADLWKAGGRPHVTAADCHLSGNASIVFDLSFPVEPARDPAALQRQRRRLTLSGWTVADNATLTFTASGRWLRDVEVWIVGITAEIRAGCRDGGVGVEFLSFAADRITNAVLHVEASKISVASACKISVASMLASQVVGSIISLQGNINDENGRPVASGSVVESFIKASAAAGGTAIVGGIGLHLGGGGEEQVVSDSILLAGPGVMLDATASGGATAVLSITVMSEATAVGTRVTRTMILCRNSTLQTSTTGSAVAVAASLLVTRGALTVTDLSVVLDDASSVGSAAMGGTAFVGSVTCITGTVSFVNISGLVIVARTSILQASSAGYVTSALAVTVNYGAGPLIARNVVIACYDCQITVSSISYASAVSLTTNAQTNDLVTSDVSLLVFRALVMVNTSKDFASALMIGAVTFPKTVSVTNVTLAAVDSAVWCTAGDAFATAVAVHAAEFGELVDVTNATLAAFNSSLTVKTFGRHAATVMAVLTTELVDSMVADQVTILAWRAILSCTSRFYATSLGVVVNYGKGRANEVTNSSIVAINCTIDTYAEYNAGTVVILTNNNCCPTTIDRCTLAMILCAVRSTSYAANSITVGTVVTTSPGGFSAVVLILCGEGPIGRSSVLASDPGAALVIHNDEFHCGKDYITATTDRIARASLIGWAALQIDVSSFAATRSLSVSPRSQTMSLRTRREASSSPTGGSASIAVVPVTPTRTVTVTDIAKTSRLSAMIEPARDGATTVPPSVTLTTAGRDTLLANGSPSVTQLSIHVGPSIADNSTTSDRPLAATMSTSVRAALVATSVTGAVVSGVTTPFTANKAAAMARAATLALQCNSGDDGGEAPPAWDEAVYSAGGWVAALLSTEAVLVVIGVAAVVASYGHDGETRSANRTIASATRLLYAAGWSFYGPSQVAHGIALVTPPFPGRGSLDRAIAVVCVVAQGVRWGLLTVAVGPAAERPIRPSHLRLALLGAHSSFTDGIRDVNGASTAALWRRGYAAVDILLALVTAGVSSVRASSPSGCSAAAAVIALLASLQLLCLAWLRPFVKPIDTVMAAVLLLTAGVMAVASAIVVHDSDATKRVATMQPIVLSGTAVTAIALVAGAVMGLYEHVASLTSPSIGKRATDPVCCAAPELPLLAIDHVARVPTPRVGRNPLNSTLVLSTA